MVGNKKAEKVGGFHVPTADGIGDERVEEDSLVAAIAEIVPYLPCYPHLDGRGSSVSCVMKDHHSDWRNDFTSLRDVCRASMKILSQKRSY